MHKISLRSLFFVVTLLIMLALGSQLQAQDDEPTAVTLVSFTATPQDNAVKLVWITGTEIGTAGFRLKRGAPEGPFEYLDFLGDDASGIIYGQGGVSDGAIYERIDNTAVNGQTYIYILVEIENNGEEVEPDNARRTVTAGLPPTNTPVSVIVPPTSAAGSTATATQTSSTTAPTSTRPNSSATSQPQASATAVRFATVTPSASQSDEPAAPTAVPNTTGSDTRTTNPATPRPTSTAASTNEAVLNDDAFGAAVALAQGEETPVPAPPVDSGYPATDTTTSSDTEVSPSYPPEETLGTAVPTQTRMAVIGSVPGYDSALATGTQPQSAPGGSRGTLFLWLGFIVALLIFVTGVIGSIVLYTRKSG